MSLGGRGRWDVVARLGENEGMARSREGCIAPKAAIRIY